MIQYRLKIAEIKSENAPNFKSHKEKNRLKKLELLEFVVLESAMEANANDGK